MLSRVSGPERTDYRNPIVAEAMRAREALRMNGNPPPVFHFDSYTGKVTLYAVKDVSKE